MRKKILLFAAIALLFVPFPTSECPEWRIRVVNRDGVPLVNKQIDQSCMNYTLGIDPCSTDDSRQFSDSDGFVRFPQRIIWAGMISRLVRSAFHLAMWPAEGSLGTRVRAFTSGPKGYPEIRCVPNQPLPDVLIVEGTE